MRFTYLFFSLLLCLTSYAQPNPLNRRAMAIAGLAKPFNPTPCIGSFTNPTQIAGLAFRWVASDQTNSSRLIDRVQGNYWWQDTVGNRPTLNGNHLDFNGTSSFYNTTNVTLTFENNTSFYLIISVTNGPDGDEQWFQDNTTSTPGRIHIWTSSGSAYIFQVGGISGTAFTGQTPIDFVYASQPTGHDKVYTNSVFYYQNSGAPVSGTESFVGQRGDNLGFAKCSFFEMGIYTNKNLSADEVCSLHYYATNTYSGIVP